VQTQARTGVDNGLLQTSTSQFLSSSTFVNGVW